jgi:hypothetical protein
MPTKTGIIKSDYQAAKHTFYAIIINSEILRVATQKIPAQIVLETPLL